MRTVRLTVNGKPVTAPAEPRTHLADFLRESQFLTGTHIGCEHGVCGACTLLIDGAPARSCITYAVACDGADITTIEGLDDDETARQLRDAFSRDHALQCGYCTPGMLMTARDIVTRLPDADDRRIRIELSGNLCRCTGYVGIVRAVRRVLDARKESGLGTRPEPKAVLGPVGSGHAPTPVPTGAAERASRTLSPIAPERTVKAARPASARSDTAAASTASAPGPAPDKPGTTIRQSFTIAHPRARVWDFFTRLDQVAACMPGASLTAAPSDDHLQGKIRVKLGPISADFAGEADIQRDPINWSGLIHGSGRDVRSSSATRGEVHYALFEENGAAATRVDIDLGFTLTGSLAQFSRSGLVNDLAGRLTAEFAKNLQARMDRAVGAPGIGPDNAGPAAELRAGALVASIIWARLKAFFRSLSGR